MFKKPTPIVLGMLVTFVVSFAAFGVGMRISPEVAALYDALTLSPLRIVHGRQLWGVVSYALLHDLTSPFHLVFNCLSLYWFGPEAEARWGARRFALFCLATTVVGALFAVAAHIAHLSDADVVGASAITTGLILAWALANRDRQVMFFFFQVKGIQLVWILIGFEILNAISLSGTSAACHFGGMLVGWLGSDVSPLRRWILQRKLRSLTAQSTALRGVRLGKADPGLRVIQGGAGRRPRKDELN